LSSPEGLEALNFVVTLFNDGFTNRDEAVTAAAPDAGVALEGKVGVLMAGENAAAISLVPSVIVFILYQRYIVQSIPVAGMTGERTGGDRGTASPALAGRFVRVGKTWQQR